MEGEAKWKEKAIGQETKRNKAMKTKIKEESKKSIYSLWNPIIFIFFFGQLLIFHATSNQFFLNVPGFSHVKKKCCFQTQSLGTDLLFTSFLLQKLQLSKATIQHVFLALTSLSPELRDGHLQLTTISYFTSSQFLWKKYPPLRYSLGSFWPPSEFIDSKTQEMWLSH